MTGQIFPRKQTKNKSIEETKMARLFFFVLVFVQLVYIGVGLRSFDLTPLLGRNFSGNDWVAVVYWVLSLPLFFLLVQRGILYRYALLLDQEGITTSGVIMKRWEQKGEKRTFFYVAYTYLSDKLAAASVDEKYYRSAREDDKIQVMYLPDQPEISRLVLSSLPEREQFKLGK